MAADQKGSEPTLSYPTLSYLYAVQSQHGRGHHAVHLSLGADEVDLLPGLFVDNKQER